MLNYKSTVDFKTTHNLIIVSRIKFMHVTKFLDDITVEVRDPD